MTFSRGFRDSKLKRICPASFFPELLPPATCQPCGALPLLGVHEVIGPPQGPQRIRVHRPTGHVGRTIVVEPQPGGVDVGTRVAAVAAVRHTAAVAHGRLGAFEPLFANTSRSPGGGEEDQSLDQSKPIRPSELGLDA